VGQNRLARQRAARQLSQKQLARQVGLSQSAIAAYETGERTPSLAVARRIARFFGVSIEDLFFDGCGGERASHR